MPKLLTEEEFWQASLTLYQRPGVQAQLLSAQDTQGRNVNLELLRMLLSDDEQGLTSGIAALTDGEYQQLHATVMAFSQAHTHKLRVLRRELSQSLLLDQKSREQLKSQLLAAELILEKQEQAMLINRLRQLRGLSSV